MCNLLYFFQAAMPDRWGRCLLGTCHSLWFLHLPAMLQVSSQPAAVLHQAYEILVKMQKLRLDPMEEVQILSLILKNRSVIFKLLLIIFFRYATEL